MITTSVTSVLIGTKKRYRLSDFLSDESEDDVGSQELSYGHEKNSKFVAGYV